ncbi:hypothetical protein CJ030_MR2G027550 [Morella rubra]|uniref:DUF7392 domain-containing protein n=1 Tax=Morella rubra TaxID=262757 RepID=A0A6A1WBR5_9ROSI|nr:hypothetical protein CJ030_MR2G027550 [Morella rubra]
MACFVPFTNRNLGLSFFVFRPTDVLVDEFVDALKEFSLRTESLGCVQNSIFKSIHGNMIVWYGAWLKTSCENKESLTTSLISMLTHISSMAILTKYSFFETYGGESRDGSVAVRFHTGDTISVYEAVVASSEDVDDVSYACLAIFRSRFLKMEGVAAGVCFRCEDKPRVGCLHVWKSLQFCYSWVINSDNKTSMMPYLDRFPLEIKYDIFRVVYVNGDNIVLNSKLSSPAQILETRGESKEEGQVTKN